MNDTQHSEATLLRRYLLGQSNVDERSAVERRLMTDQQFLDDLARAEEELIDEYARGNLAPDEKDGFEALFLNAPERREKIAFAQAFSRYLARHPIAAPAKSREHIPSVWWRRAVLGLSAAVLLLVSLTTFFYLRIVQLRGQLASVDLQRVASEKNGKTLSAQLNEQQSRNHDLQQEIAGLRDRGPSSDLLTLRLASSWTRGGGQLPTARLLASTKRLRLDLMLDRDALHHKSYQAQLQTVDGGSLWSSNRLLARTKGEKSFISVNLPASVLTAGDFRIALSGLAANGVSEEVATFYFRIEKK